MLKLTYTETGLSLEILEQPLEIWVNTWVLLTLRSGTALWVEPTTATFILPIDLPHIGELLNIVHEEIETSLELYLGDEEGIEVNLDGTWLSSNANAEEGVFVCGFSDRTEACLYRLWQASEHSASVLNE